MNLRDGIGAGLIGAFIISIPLLIYKEIPQSNEQLIAYMLGQLSGFVAAVVAFHYVTKAGEKELDAKRADNTAKALDAIKAAQEAPATPATDEAGQAAQETADAAQNKADDIQSQEQRP